MTWAVRLVVAMVVVGVLWDILVAIVGSDSAIRRLTTLP